MNPTRFHGLEYYGCWVPLGAHTAAAGDICSHLPGVPPRGRSSSGFMEPPCIPKAPGRDVVLPQPHPRRGLGPDTVHLVDRQMPRLQQSEAQLQPKAAP